jgi:hypothetical protein
MHDLSLGRQESAEQTCKPARDSGIKIEKDRWIEGDENRGAWGKGVNKFRKFLSFHATKI